MDIVEEKNISNFLSIHSKWKLKERKLSREFLFPNFIYAFSFMSAIAVYAESKQHHPEWSNVYNRVNISLFTHDIQGLSQLDLDLAIYIEEVYVNFTKNK